MLNTRQHLVVRSTGLTKQYGNAEVVSGVGLEVPARQVYGFLGPNGAGKSTTMKMLLGLTRPTNGSVEVFGEPFSPGRTLSRVGSLIEQPSFYGHLTGRENLDIVRRVTHLGAASIDQALARNYSLGMKQRLGLAMALLGEPELLILDEPTNGLDPSGIHEIRELITSLPASRGITVMVSSHLLSEIEQMADTIGIISHGHLLYQGPLSALAEAGHIVVRTRPEQAVPTAQTLATQGWRVSSVQGGEIIMPAYDDDHVARLVTTLVTAGTSIYRVELRPAAATARSAAPARSRPSAASPEAERSVPGTITRLLGYPRTPPGPSPTGAHLHPGCLPGTSPAGRLPGDEEGRSMKALGLEISKLKRSRLWLTLLLATGLELVWATALTVISLAKAPSGVAATTGYAIGSATDVHNLVAPIISAVVASRLAATEHDSTMLSQLLADGQSRTSLFLAKLTTALAICSVPVITLVATTTLVATANGVPTDLGMTATWLGGLLVANIAMTAIHLVLALLVHRQALTLSVGALGGLLGTLTDVIMPNSVAAVLPWQYPALLSPVRLVFGKGTTTGVAPVDHLGAYIVIVIVIGLAATALAQAAFNRQVTR